MELRQIRYFLAICEHGGFSRAASACDVSQPALTKAMKALEDEGGAELLARRLEAAELDLVIAHPAAGFGDPFRSQFLYRERYVVIFAPGHPLTECEELRLENLNGLDYVDRLACEMRELVLKLLGDQAERLYARFRSEREDWVQTMVLAGLGFAFMPEYSVTVGGLLSRPLVEPPLARDIHAFEVRGRLRAPAAIPFLEQLAQFDWRD